MVHFMTWPTEFQIISQKYSNSNHWSREIELYQTLFHWKLNIQRTMEFHLIISFHYVDNRIRMGSFKDKSRWGPNTSEIYNIYKQLMWYGESIWLSLDRSEQMLQHYMTLIDQKYTMNNFLFHELNQTQLFFSEIL